MVLNFTVEEYQERLNQVKKRMDQEGIEVLLITDPANMNYLTGYDAWSFYVHQMVVVAVDVPQPIWIGRLMDANGARRQVWMHESNIISYPDYYVNSTKFHPMQFVADVLIQRGLQNRSTGVEMDQYYFSAKAYTSLIESLPNAQFKDATSLVNWVRIIKSDLEIDFMRKAGAIAGKAMDAAVTSIHTGARQCDAVASIYDALIRGTDGYGGDYPSIVPMLPTGENTSAPHITWCDEYFQEGQAVIIELAGCYKRYHSPLARTVFLGQQPTERMKRLDMIVNEGIEQVLQTAKPGVYLEELEEAWLNSTRKYGIEKESRLGYSIGLNYPPDWGEHTASIRKGDRTVLQPNMTFHFIPGLWFDNDGIETSESFRVTENGVELLANYQRELITKVPYQFPDESKGVIS